MAALLGLLGAGGAGAGAGAAAATAPALASAGGAAATAGPAIAEIASIGAPEIAGAAAPTLASAAPGAIGPVAPIQQNFTTGILGQTPTGTGTFNDTGLVGPSRTPAAPSGMQGLSDGFNSALKDKFGEVGDAFKTFSSEFSDDPIGSLTKLQESLPQSEQKPVSVAPATSQRFSPGPIVGGGGGTPSTGKDRLRGALTQSGPQLDDELQKLIGSLNIRA